MTLAILGINLQDVRVLASAEQVLVRGDYRHHSETDDGIVHLSDFKSATLFRTVRFPEPIDVNSMDVQLEHGILRITAQKARAAKRTSRKAPARKRKAS